MLTFTLRARTLRARDTRERGILGWSSRCASLATLAARVTAVHLAEVSGRSTFTGVSLEFAYQFRQAAPRLGFKDLDGVVLAAAVMSDDGVTIPVGTEGTIVSVHGAGESFVVEFAEPIGALAIVMPDQILPEHDAAF